MIRVHSLDLKGLRCWQKLRWEPGPEINILIGGNGVGKTSLLEGIHLALGLRPLLGHKLDPLIPEGQEHGFVAAVIETHGRQRHISIGFSKGQRRVRVDEKRLRHPDQILQQQAVVPFVPSDLHLVQGGPQARRKLLDQTAFYQHREHAENLRRYNQSLAARNALLRGRRPDPALLDVWSQELARYGAEIHRIRKDCSQTFRSHLKKAYQALSGPHEDLDVELDSSLSAEDPADQLLTMLRQAERKDLKRGYTSVGPHHDDWNFTLAGRQVRRHASQGQQRSAVLAARLALVDWVIAHRGYRPVLLLDDVAGDLDSSRRKHLFEQLLREGGQVFMTGTGEETVRPFSGRSVQLWSLPRLAELR